MTKRRGVTRRGFMTTGLTAAAALGLAPRLEGWDFQPTACTLMPEQEVGPFYIADELVRADIREGKAGFPLELRIAIQDTRTCKPLANAAIDLWHCDALGLYSGFTAMSEMGGPGGPEGRGRGRGPGRGGPPPDGGGPPAMQPTDKQTFCRGIQLTDKDGVATFTTVFPGFYQGRTNHIHFKVRIDGRATERTYEAGHTSHIGQVFFPEDVSAKLMALEPYRSHAIHRTTQDEDGIYQDEHGAASVATLHPVKKDDPAAGFRASLIAGVDPTATPAPVGGRGRGGRGRGRG